ncbi:hypothetical protein RCH21_000966 [Arthrobacter sp. PL16]|uniref:DUF6221 family protein n=1 Tax=Arthrobacter sp. PL16 TaxID=3071720 RepID=UPI002E01E1E1|nr:hypothetical protein [Arthrobacter sp. PL16]
MDELTAFLEARLTEDEKAARTGDLPEEVWGARGWHDPELVLSECRTKRRLVLYATTQLDESHGFDVLKLLALPWSARTDYRQEWRT